MRRTLGLVAALLGLWMSAAPAAADSGSITVTGVTSSTSYRQTSATVNVSFTVVEDSCASDSYCGWFAHLDMPAQGHACNPHSPVWVGSLTEGQGSFPYAASFEHYGTAGIHRLCLYVYSNGADALVAQHDFQIPAGQNLTTPETPAPGFDDKDCADFVYQEDAQAYLTPDDAHGLDADDDGTACDSLPRRPLPVNAGPDAQCSDDRDNDGDGSIDGDDWHCADPDDDSEAIPRLRFGEAKRYMKKALKRRFKSTYRHGYAKRLRRCGRLSRLGVKCRRVSWVIGDLSYAGWVTIRATTTNRGRDVWRSAYRITQTNEYCLVTSQRRCRKTYRARF